MRKDRQDCSQHWEFGSISAVVPYQVFGLQDFRSKYVCITANYKFSLVWQERAQKLLTSPADHHWDWSSPPPGEEEQLTDTWGQLGRNTSKVSFSASPSCPCAATLPAEGMELLSSLKSALASSLFQTAHAAVVRSSIQRKSRRSWGTSPAGKNEAQWEARSAAWVYQGSQEPSALFCFN